MQPRTKRQKQVLEIITRYIENHGYEPSYQEIARYLGVSSKAGIAKHIEALERQGFITRRRENGSFNLELKQTNSNIEDICMIDWLEIPQVENVDEEQIYEPLFVPRFLLGSNDPARIFAFRVMNDAMIEAHVCEGDIALIENRPFARDGNCVIAVVERKKLVLMRIYREGANFRLTPANQNYESLKISAEKVEIKGVLRGLLRPLL